MSVSVGFITGSKRENSTKQLPITVTYNCTFKNGCSMLTPTLFLELNSGTFPNFTGFKIEDRYYFVTNIESVRNNLFEISGKVDVLATYKSNILATKAYVIYDSTSNSELVDNRLPMKTSKSVSASRTACPFVPDGGCYILSLTGSNNTTGVYKATENELAALMDDVSYIYDDFFINGIPSPPTPPVPPTSGTIADEIEFAGDMIMHFVDSVIWLFDVIKNPISQFFGSNHIPENIRECKYIPFNVGTTGASINIYLGTFQTQQSLGKLATETVHRTASVSIPWQANDWRRRSPFTEIYLYLPYIGMVNLSSENLSGQSSLEVAYTLALRDGSLICTVKSGDQVIGQYSGNVAASVPVGISNISIPKAASSLIAFAKSAVQKNLGGVGMAALQFGDSITPNFSCIGGLDGIAGIATDQNITCYTVFHDTNVAPNSELATIGSPTMAPKSLATLTNYVQTMSASVDGAMSSDERIKLNNLLDSGIYIE